MLGPADGEWVAMLCGVTHGGTFEHGMSVLQLRSDPEDPGRWARCRASLLAARRTRQQPARDDKVVAAWNGLAIAALAEAGALLDEPAWTAAAVACAELLVELHWDADRRDLARISRAGVVGTHAAGVLEDHADFAEGLLALFQTTGDERWFGLAKDLLEASLERFGDGSGGFYDTAADAPALVRRPRDPSDGVTPSGASATANALLTLGALTGDTAHLAGADSALATLLPLARRAPRFAGWALSAITARLAGPVQVAVALPAGADDSGLHGSGLQSLGVPRSVPLQSVLQGSGLHRIALGSTSPGLVVAVGEEGRSAVPLLADRPAVGGRPTAYPCRGFVCDLPVTDPEALRAALG